MNTTPSTEEQGTELHKRSRKQSAEAFVLLPVSAKNDMANNLLQIPTAVMLAVECRLRENGGRIQHAREILSKREHRRAMGIHPCFAQQIFNEESPFWHWEDDTLVVDFYSAEYEQKIHRMRELARRAGIISARKRNARKQASARKKNARRQPSVEVTVQPSVEVSVQHPIQPSVDASVQQADQQLSKPSAPQEVAPCVEPTFQPCVQEQIQASVQRCDRHSPQDAVHQQLAPSVEASALPLLQWAVQQQFQQPQQATVGQIQREKKDFF